MKISSMASRRRRQSSDRRSLALNFVPPDRELGRKQPKAPPLPLRACNLRPSDACGRQALLTSQTSPQYLIVACTHSPVHFSELQLNYPLSCIQDWQEVSRNGNAYLLKNLTRYPSGRNEQCGKGLLECANFLQNFYLPAGI